MHIVFQQDDINTLTKSFDLDETLRDEIIEIKDDYAVGPLKNIYSDEGIEARKQWWREVLAGGDLDGHVDTGEVNDNKTVEEIKEKLSGNKDEKVWIWVAPNKHDVSGYYWLMAQLKEILRNDKEETVMIWVAPNKHDVSGYYWLMSQLKEFVTRVFVISLNNLPFINDKGNIFYPENLFEIPPREFLKAKKLARLISASEFELDPDEWLKICNENKIVRVLEGAKKLSQHNEDFYDKYILEFVTDDWQKATKVIQHFLNKAKYTTGDAFAFWRLKELVLNETIVSSGEIKNIKEFEVKKKGTSEEPKLDEES